ncbi:MAG TPA: T9SS type A sorting domain-containing protein, partial [Bacteroidia bacterium]|nr:T9SS type A sorting domain-containing protein [Bacteroidia bacterium]
TTEDILSRMQGVNLIKRGSSVIVHTGSLNLSSPVWNPKAFFCFYTSTPQHPGDYNISNDRYCDSVSMLLTGIPKYEFSHVEIKLFPNPVSESLQIKSPQRIEYLRLYNYTGTILKESRPEKQNPVVDLDDLSPGVYFLELETENRLITKKIIRQ